MMKQHSPKTTPENVAQSAVKRHTIARGSGVSTVYNELKREILDMTLAPGDLLDETSLSTRFALSRTPIREALIRLTSEGLINTLPNRNTVVAQIDFETVPAYLDALVLMYRVTTRLAALKRKPEDIQLLRRVQENFASSVSRTDAIAMITTNRDFHLAIAMAGGNQYYIDFFSRLLDQGQRLLRLYYSTYNDRLPQRFVDEHDAIINAIENSDLVHADELGKQHALQVVSQIQAFLSQGIGRTMEIAEFAND